VAQDFWASSGYGLLERGAEGLRPTDAWLARFLDREELRPPEEAGPGERELHARLAAAPRAEVTQAAIAAVEDPDARENWRAFLTFRDRIARHATLEDAYRALFAGGVDVAPVFVDALAQAIARSMLEGTADAWLCRAAELLFRRQRVAVESGRALAADAATIEAYAETGGFGSVGRLIRSHGTATAAVKMDVLTHENAPFYFLRDELYSFVLDMTSGGEGAAALARVLELWIAHMAGVAVTIEPAARVDDAHWRWHVGLDADATAILDALYRAQAVPAADLERLLLLFRLRFRDARDAAPEVAGHPVYLGLACRPDRTLKMKPQNLLANLPLSASPIPARG
jgi:hypothetical protein